MSRSVEMHEIDCRKVPACLVEFLRDNATLKIHAKDMTAYVNPLARQAGNEPAFTLQVADHEKRVAIKVFLDFEEAALIVTNKNFEEAADILAAAIAQGRPTWRHELPERRRQGQP